MEDSALKAEYAREIELADDLEKNRRRLLDYAHVGQQLFVQRVVIYTTAIFLAGAYYSWRMAEIGRAHV